LRTKSGQRQCQTQTTASHNHIVKVWMGEKGKKENSRDGWFRKVCNFSLPHRLRVARRRILRQDSNIASWASRVFPKRFLWICATSLRVHRYQVMTLGNQYYDLTRILHHYD